MAKLQALLSQVAQLFVDGFAAISGAYYSSKYAALTRRLGLPRMAEVDTRGFVAIQIDGLSYPHLQFAIQQGYAPYLQRMLRRGSATLHQWRTGLPSNTPAAQAGIMYGANDEIPGFRWYDKVKGEAVVCKYPGVLHAVRQRLPNRGPGLLSGGSSLMNMFDGDAATSIFTVGALHGKRFVEGVRGAGFLLLFALNAFRAVRTAVLALWEHLVDLVQRTHARLWKRYPRPMAAVFPFLRVLSNVILRELQTFAVQLDVYRGVPRIYTTYFGYDELAHSYGPTSRVAFRALHAIDRRIQQIDTLRRLVPSRPYDLYILSDHGMTSSVPFSHAYGQTLGEFIRKAAGEERALSEVAAAWSRDSLGPAYLLDELSAIEANTVASLRHIPRKLHQLVEARLRQQTQAEDAWNLEPRPELVVLNSGPMAHVYFNVSSAQLDLSQVAAMYPTLLGKLLEHPGIGLVVARELEQVHLLSRSGYAIVGSDYAVEGDDPLASLPDPCLSAAQLQRLARCTQAGDLIVFGRYEPDRQETVCFEPQWACHGGLGGPQELAFMLTPSSVDWDVNSVTEAPQIYTLFARQYAERAA
jgi:hypothetical protein